MKIVAQADKAYLVEMTEEEIARAAGYTHPYDSGWRTNRPADRHGNLVIGTKIDVNAAYYFHSRIEQHQATAQAAAATLRELAGLIDGVMPGVVIPPPRAAGTAGDGA